MPNVPHPPIPGKVVTNQQLYGFCRRVSAAICHALGEQDSPDAKNGAGESYISAGHATYGLNVGARAFLLANATEDEAFAAAVPLYQAYAENKFPSPHLYNSYLHNANQEVASDYMYGDEAVPSDPPPDAGPAFSAEQVAAFKADSDLLGTLKVKAKGLQPAAFAAYFYAQTQTAPPPAHVPAPTPAGGTPKPGTGPGIVGDH